MHRWYRQIFSIEIFTIPFVLIIKCISHYCHVHNLEQFQLKRKLPITDPSTKMNLFGCSCKKLLQLYLYPSAVYEVVLLDIPDYQFMNNTEDESYFSIIFIFFKFWFTEKINLFKYLLNLKYYFHFGIFPVECIQVF